jgi:Fic family protein
MRFDPDKPYNDLPLLPPKVELETKAVLRKAIAANKALAELKGAGDLIPNQGVLINAIILQEAKLSSEIENVVTTNDELYRAFADAGHNTNPHTKEVLHYSEALWHGFETLKKKKRPLTTNLFLDLFQIVKQTTEGIRKGAGTKLKNPATDAIIYTPPEGERLVRDKLANLEKYIYAEDEIDPLVKLAVLHYQFEAIHPFTDGNGRTGRIINILFLIERGLLDIPVLYLSRYIIENKNGYYLALRQVTEKGAWEEWILYMLNGMEQTARETRERIVAIKDLMNKTAELVRKKVPKIYSKDLVEVVFHQPYSKIKFLEEMGIGNRQTVSSYLRSLEKIGILKGIKKGRDVYYLNVRFLDLLAK